MPRERAAAAPTGRIPGLYEHIREIWQGRVCDGDPRVPFIIDDPAERRRLNRKSPMVREAKRMVEKLNRGEPVCYPCGHVGGRDRFPEARNIPWLADHREMWVDADDSVRPAQPYRLALA